MDENSRDNSGHNPTEFTQSNSYESGRAGSESPAERAEAAAQTITLSDAIRPPGNHEDEVRDDSHPAAAIADLLHESRSELDGLLEETQKMHERSWRLIDSLLQQLQLKAWRSVDAAVDGLGKEIRERVNYEISVMLENFEIEANARLAARTDEALSRARESYLRMDQELTRVAAEDQKRLTQLSTNTIEELQTRGEGLRTTLQTQADEKLAALSKSAEQTREELRQIDEARLAEAKKRSDQALQDFQARLESLAEQAATRAEQRIEEITKSSISNVTRQAREIVEREMSESFIEALRSRIDQLADVFKR